MKRTATAALLLLLVGSVSACGSDDESSSSGDSTSDYCDVLDSAKDTFQGLDPATLAGTNLDDLSSQLEELESAAPDEVAADWSQLNEAFDGFRQLLDDAGISLEDLQGMAQGQPPADMDATDLQELQTAFTEYEAEFDVTTANEAISEHAKSECGIDLGDTPTESTATAPEELPTDFPTDELPTDFPTDALPTDVPSS